MITEKQLIEGFRRRVWAVMNFREIRQTYLEEMAGLGSGVLTHFFQGRFAGTRTTLLFAVRIADALTVDVGWLITGREPMKHRTHPQLRLDPIRGDSPRGKASPDFRWSTADRADFAPPPAEALRVTRTPKARKPKAGKAKVRNTRKSKAGQKHR